MARKRKPGKRTKSGRLSEAYRDPEVRDQGTSEVRVKRQALVGAGGDPMLSVTAPGILFSHGYLDREQYDEAHEFARLRCILYGSPWPGSMTIGPGASEERISDIKRRFDDRVFGLTEEQKRILTDVTVFNCIPTWFFCLQLGLKMLAEDEAERAGLIKALNSMLGRRDYDPVPYRETLGAKRRALLLEVSDLCGYLDTSVQVS